MAGDISPEERLLRLIRSKKPQPVPEEEERATTLKQESPIPLAVTDTGTPFKKGLRWANCRPSLKLADILRFENLNLALVFLLIGVVIYSIPIFLKKPRNVIEDLEERIKPAKKSLNPEEREFKTPPLSYFVQEVNSRNIFSPIAKEDAKPETPVDEGPKMEDIKEQLSLLGVIGGDKPQAIIEDKKMQKTYFLNKGGIFDQVQVKDILDNKVILIYKDQEFELII